MTEQNVSVQFSGNVDELLAALKNAKTAINDAFDLRGIASSERQKPVTDLFKNLQASSDAAIRGMIKGTETWQQALSAAVLNLEVRFAQLAAHRMFNWLQSELGMTAATREGNTLRRASDEEAGQASLAARAQHAVSSILNDSREVFGGIFAFLSPVMGPAAAGPAAAGSASVAALSSQILYAETGAWHIPSDTFAYLHAGEMVVPQPFADSLRNSGNMGGAGDSYTISIHAIDTQTGAQFLKNNAGAIATALAGQVRNFNRQVTSLKG